jgi:hypothetical protein
MSLCERFEKIHGYKFTEPVTYNEKLFWRMMDKRNCPERIVEMANKYTARSFIDGSGACSIPIATGYPMFVKANNMSGRNRLVTSDEDLSKVVRWILRQPRDYGAKKGEWWYQEMTPCILYEEVLEDFTEVKFFCFHGRAEFIQILDGKKRSWFTREGRYLNMNSLIRKKSKIRKLPDITEALKVADRLSKDVDHVRVDLILSDKIYFTEFTFAHISGRDKWSDPDFDRHMGSFWRLP